jgi:hypothetical protein
MGLPENAIPDTPGCRQNGCFCVLYVEGFAYGAIITGWRVTLNIVEDAGCNRAAPKENLSPGKPYTHAVQKILV